MVPATDDRCATGLQFGELTWNDPSDRINVAGKNFFTRGMPLGVNQNTAALAGGTIPFDAGTTPDTTGLVFDLTPIMLTPGYPTTLNATC